MSEKKDDRTGMDTMSIILKERQQRQLSESMPNRNTKVIRHLNELLADSEKFELFLADTEKNTALSAPGDMKEQILMRAERLGLTPAHKKETKESARARLWWYSLKISLGTAAAVAFVFAAGIADMRQMNTGYSGGLFSEWMQENRESGKEIMDEISQAFRRVSESIEELVEEK
ncbi:MAG: hypothetical protein J6B85_09405 [Lachnospiraceae bacterium]|nr:hypothetical protein [Lachnospiraceae bacterium]